MCKFRCEICGEEFEKICLEHVDRGSSVEKLMCEDCIDKLLGDELELCQNCGNVFSRSRLQLNKETDFIDVCPHCGKVWCE